MPRRNTTKNTTNAMPRKNTTSVANIPRSAAEEEDTHVCPICTEPIVDEDEDGCAHISVIIIKTLQIVVMSPSDMQV